MSETKNLKLFKHDEPLETNQNPFDVEKALNNNWDKIDDFVGEIDNKIDTLEEDISNIKEEQTAQNEELEVLKNALPSETQEGESINIKGTIPVKFKEFAVKGNSKQEENVDLDYTTKNAIIIGGPALSNSDLGKTAIIKAKPNTTYTISRSIKTSRFKICESEEEWDESNNFALSKQIDLSELSGNYTTSKTGNYLYVFYWYSTGGDTTIPEITVTTKFTPEYPSPIQNVEGDVNITVCNKNLYELDGKSILRNGVDYIIENNSIIAERKTVSSSGSYYNDMTRKKLLAGTYTISGVDSSFIYEKARVEIFVADSENKDESKATRIEVISNDRPSIQYSSDKDFYIIFSVVVTGKSDVGEKFVFKPQVEVGSTATNFVENKKQIITFPLLEGQKLYLNDYFADDGIHHVRKQVELDGTEEIIQYTRKYPNTYGYRITIKGLKSSENKLSALSSRYKSITFSDFYNNAIDHIGEMAIHNGTDSYVYFGSNKTTVEEFKEEVKGTVLEFTLVEEEVEEYTPEQQEAYNQLKQLKAYEEETNIFSTDEISPIFKVSAVQKASALLTQVSDLNNKVTQLSQQILEIAGGN